MPEKSSTNHLFWARELVQLARKQAAEKGVPDHVMAQAMLVQAWMLFTGQDEKQARKSVSSLYSNSIAKKPPTQATGQITDKIERGGSKQ